MFFLIDCTCDGVDLFTCGSCECLEQYHQCDGKVDCADGSDEQGCGKYSFSLTVPNPNSPWVSDQGAYSPTILKKILCLFLQDL